MRIVKINCLGCHRDSRLFPEGLDSRELPGICNRHADPCRSSQRVHNGAQTKHLVLRDEEELGDLVGRCEPAFE